MCVTYIDFSRFKACFGAGKVESLINDKLITHSVRVAFILMKMLQYEGKYEGLELRKILFAAIFHDIGAYKTEEIRDLMDFEIRSHSCPR